MTHNFKPGDVAMAHSERVFMDLSREWRWVETERVCLDQPPYGLRPLVVIDPEDREAVERLLVAYHDHHVAFADVTDMQAALREYANPTPPRPDEPQGLGAVVEDEGGNRWMRHEPDPGRGNRNHAWYPAGYVSDGVRVKWDRITAVRVLSPGVEVDQ